MSATYYLNELAPITPVMKESSKEESVVCFATEHCMHWRDKCGGNFTYTESGIKDCSFVIFLTEKKIMMILFQKPSIGGNDAITIPMKNN